MICRQFVHLNPIEPFEDGARAAIVTLSNGDE